MARKDLTEKMIYEYFDQNIPEPKQENIDKLIERMRNMPPKTEQKTQKKPFAKWKFALVTCLVFVLMVPAIVLPIVLRPEEEKYYTSSDVTRVDLTNDFVTNYIDQNYSQYNFIFDDTTIDFVYGYYTDDNNKLVDIKLNLIKQDVPFTEIYFEIVVNKHFTINNKNRYTHEAEITTNANYTLYEKTIENVGSATYLKYFEYSNHEVYLEMNLEDLEFFNNFL